MKTDQKQYIFPAKKKNKKQIIVLNTHNVATNEQIST